MPLYIDENNILQPLGVRVTRDSRYELLPGTRENTEEIPGRHGEIDFGAELQPRTLELHCIIGAKFKTEQQSLRAALASALNPLLGPQDLTFADDPGKVYRVRYAGKIDLKRYPIHTEFVIPFKMCDPFIVGTTENVITANGIANCMGTVETPFIYTVTGPSDNPILTVNGESMEFYGILDSGSTLTIDTEKLTAKAGNVNVLSNFNDTFPKLQPGSNTISFSGGGTMEVRWRDRWI